jgi:WXG100 family type VII secretion target
MAIKFIAETREGRRKQMAGGSTNVNVQAMAQSQASFQDELNNMLAKYNDVTEQADNLQLAWAGPAATQYINALGSWMENFNTVINSFQYIINNLEASTGVYSGTAQETEQLAQKASADIQQDLANLNS